MNQIEISLNLMNTFYLFKVTCGAYKEVNLGAQFLGRAIFFRSILPSFLCNHQKIWAMCPTLPSSARKPADLRSAFDVLDVDRDGKISHHDLKVFYAADAADEMMTVADLNKDGYVEYEEFEKVLRTNMSRNGGGVMEDVFNDMDRDGDGKVGHEDLRTYLTSAGIEVSDDDIKAMVRLGGGGGDDNTGVTFQGFLKILAI